MPENIFFSLSLHPKTHKSPNAYSDTKALPSILSSTRRQQSNTCERTLRFLLPLNDRQVPLPLLVCQLRLPSHQRRRRLGFVER